MYGVYGNFEVRFSFSIRQRIDHLNAHKSPHPLTAGMDIVGGLYIVQPLHASVNHRMVQCVRPAAKIFTDFTSIDFGAAKLSRRCTAWYGKPAFCTLLYAGFAYQPPIQRQILHSAVKCFTERTSKNGF